jgi:DNA-directed RNA polymerase sigma subunit (sigma70/sigma32)
MLLDRGILNNFLYAWLEEEAKRFEPVADAHITAGIETMFTTLTGREEKILRLRFGLDDGKKLSQREIAEHYGVNIIKIKNVEQKAFKRYLITGVKIRLVISRRCLGLVL